MDFVLSTQGNLRSFFFSHKVGWGAAVVANVTGEPAYAKLARDIADYLVSIQEPSGAWLTAMPYYTSFDQTAEISIWLREIHAELGVSGDRFQATFYFKSQFVPQLDNEKRSCAAYNLKRRCEEKDIY